MSRSHSIAVIAGDGIGPEVVSVALACAERAAARHDVRLTWRELDWGCERYARSGTFMPDDGLDQLASADAILLGAVGWPSVPDHLSLWGLLIPIRRAFDQYVNLRPARLLPGVVSPLRGVDELDLVIVRENVEGEYSQVGGVVEENARATTALQQSVFTRRGIERVTRYAAKLAAERSGRLTSATKSNGLVHSMPFWDQVVAEVCAQEDVAVEAVHVDALAARLVTAPGSCDVVVGSNLFGDILSDLASAIAGSLGVAPSANLNPERDHPSMFEPIHGSAPDIAGKGVANPVATLWAASMMLAHLGEAEAADDLYSAFTGVMADGCLTADLGGSATTSEFGAEVVRRLS
ncbi:isocitrate/isopropylmalate dehydrogenase family protein [Nocardioides bigeumensis]|uniref:Tartrate dehydrogenase n=1 Tax=Nocardioides bigeumensis TaxID=433657 RepID=A0ABN2Y8N3_9ACTN